MNCHHEHSAVTRQLYHSPGLKKTCQIMETALWWGKDQKHWNQFFLSSLALAALVSNSTISNVSLLSNSEFVSFVIIGPLVLSQVTVNYCTKVWAMTTTICALMQFLKLSYNLTLWIQVSHWHMLLPKMLELKTRCDIHYKYLGKLI